MRKNIKDKSGRTLINSKGLLVLNKDTWTTIKGQTVSKTIRGWMPSKKEIYDNKGNLKVSKTTFDILQATLNYANIYGVRPTRDEKGRFAESPELGVDQVLNGRLDRVAIGVNKNKGIKSPLSLDEQVRAVAAKIVWDAMTSADKKSVMVKAKQAGAVHDSIWYALDEWMKNGKLDISKLDKEYAKVLLEMIELGEASQTFSASEIADIEDIAGIKLNGSTTAGSTLTPTVNEREERLVDVILLGLPKIK